MGLKAWPQNAKLFSDTNVSYRVRDPDIHLGDFEKRGTAISDPSPKLKKHPKPD